jgi:Domain of unknown function (DUF5597)/Beta-galactosidase
MRVNPLAALLVAATILTAAPMPRLVKNKGAFQFLVDDRPFLILGIQTRNSSGYPAELERTWPLATLIHANTVEIPIQWQTVEPEQGRFDFTVVDGLVAGAKAHGLHLILAWFGGFKNGAMHFAPAWVKEDVAKYPRMIDQAGNPIRTLATHVETTLAADAHAFATLMRHLSQIDGEQHTVIAIQLENEAGVLGTDRDHSALADQLFAGPVPAPVLKAFGKSSSGTWTAVFGPYASETFAAYYQAQYLNSVAEAGKRQFPLPLFLNVWTDIQDGFYEPGFSHPSGGATTRMLPLYKAIAPAIDWISPDIYKESYVQYIAEATPYSRPDNPLFIPETGHDLGFCRRMFYALGDLKGIGVSVFGVEGSPQGDSKIPEGLTDLAATYRVLTAAAPLLAEAKAAGKLRSMVEEQGIATLVADFGDYEAMAQFGPSGWGYGGARAKGTQKTTGRALIGQIGPKEFVVAGFDTTVSFRPKFGSATPRADFVSVEEGAFEDGVWKSRRQLSGDEIFFGLRLAPAGTVVKLKLMNY